MTTIARTIYRRMKRICTIKELNEALTPTDQERRFITTMTRTVRHQLNLMLWIELFPSLGYFPAVDQIPPAIVVHVWGALSLPEDLVPFYNHPRTLYHHQQLVWEYYQIVPNGKDIRRIALHTILRAIRTMDNLAYLFNAELDELVKQCYELPAQDFTLFTQRRMKNATHRVFEAEEFLLLHF